MSNPWKPTETKLEDADPSKAYFVCKRYGLADQYFSYVSRGLNGKTTLSSKPGIAIQVDGDSHTLLWLHNNPGFCLVSVPPDAAKRWRARKPVFNHRKGHLK